MTTPRPSSASATRTQRPSSAIFLGSPSTLPDLPDLPSSPASSGLPSPPETAASKDSGDEKRAKRASISSSASLSSLSGNRARRAAKMLDGTGGGSGGSSSETRSRSLSRSRSPSEHSEDGEEANDEDHTAKLSDDRRLASSCASGKESEGSSAFQRVKSLAQSRRSVRFLAIRASIISDCDSRCSANSVLSLLVHDYLRPHRLQDFHDLLRTLTIHAFPRTRTTNVLLPGLFHAHRAPRQSVTALSMMPIHRRKTFLKLLRRLHRRIFAPKACEKGGRLFQTMNESAFRLRTVKRILRLNDAQKAAQAETSKQRLSRPLPILAGSHPQMLDDDSLYLVSSEQA